MSFDINGPWTDDGRSKPVIASAGNVVVIDMSFAHRPTATGAVIDASSIVVTFPMRAPSSARSAAATPLRWSNGSTWHKVFTGPTVIDLNDNWSGGLHISQVNGFVKITMATLHRPDAMGYFVSPSLFMINFPDDRNTPFATVQAEPDLITWSNGSAVTNAAAGRIRSACDPGFSASRAARGPGRVRRPGGDLRLVEWTAARHAGGLRVPRRRDAVRPE